MNDAAKIEVWTGRLQRWLTLVPILAFLFAFIHEACLSWALNINILRFYSPSDFLLISLQYVLPTFPPILLTQIFLFFERPAPQTAREKRIQTYILIFLSIIAALLVTYFFLTGSNTSDYGRTVIPFIFVYLYFYIGADNIFEDFRPQARCVLLFTQIIAATGYTEGRDFRLQKTTNVPIIEIRDQNPLAGDLLLIRLLSSGALVIDHKLNVVLYPTSKLESISTHVGP